MNEIKKYNKKILFFIVILLLTVFANIQTTYAECVYDGENFHIKDEPDNIVSPIHRLFNTKTGVHLYTRGVDDANKILGKWTDFEYTDGTPAFCMHIAQQPGLTPIYRLFNTKTGVHLYTRGTADRDKILQKYSDFEFTDGAPAFWASLTQQPGLTPIYRLFNTKTGVHLYTRGTTDRDKILQKYSDFEFTDGAPAFWADITHDSGPPLYRYQGPEITIGLYAYTKTELRDNSFRIKSDKSYIIKDKNGTKIATIPANITTKVKYLDDDAHTLQIYDSIPEITTTDEITFESAKEYDAEMVFEIVRPEMTFSKYRDKIQLRYSNNSGTKRIWIINKIPLEHYIWGMGEITGTGPMEYNKLMTTAYRTYGYWKILYSTKYAVEGFKVNATPGNQLYYGYEWEKRYPRIREGAESTRGKMVKYDGELAITPYSSWTDGRTRNPEEVGWNPSIFPHCKSVNDPYGKNTTMSTQQLFDAGNHMVGISAHGALNLADDHGWDWQKIMKYYLTGINIISIY